uniref:CSON005706 protein n=1 Tax=Culicoides sonorensis TaxID=179676 RepID=A0A336MR84_CULSO
MVLAPTVKLSDGHQMPVLGLGTYLIAEGAVKREELFVVTKLWNSFHDPAHVETAFQKSLENLNLDYIDLYLMHMPMAYEFRGFDGDLLPKDADGNLCYALLDEKVIEIGKKYGKTSGQVVLKYLVQELGVVPIPKSANSERIKQNIDIFDFTLTPEDCQYLDSLNTNTRTIPFALCLKHKYYPFNEEF